MHPGMQAMWRKRAAGLLLLFLISAVGLPAGHQLVHVLEAGAFGCVVGKGLQQATNCKHLPDPCRLFASLRSLPATGEALSALKGSEETVSFLTIQAIVSFLPFAPFTRAPPVLC